MGHARNAAEGYVGTLHPANRTKASPPVRFHVVQLPTQRPLVQNEFHGLL
jgi:hypothetical protein